MIVKAVGALGLDFPGVTLQVIDPDADGVGEVIARGDNVMAGYFNDPESTASTVRRDGYTPGI